jgi:hypothetical protein
MLASRAEAVHCRGGDDVVLELSTRDQAVLDFERTWWLRAAGSPKHAAIRAELGVSPTSFYAALGRLMDWPAAYAYDPLLVTRLRRRRATRRWAAFNDDRHRRRRRH